MTKARHFGIFVVGSFKKMKKQFPLQKKKRFRTSHSSLKTNESILLRPSSGVHLIIFIAN